MFWNNHIKFILTFLFCTTNWLDGNGASIGEGYFEVEQIISKANGTSLGLDQQLYQSFKKTLQLTVDESLETANLNLFSVNFSSYELGNAYIVNALVPTIISNYQITFQTTSDVQTEYEHIIKIINSNIEKGYFTRSLLNHANEQNCYILYQSYVVKTPTYSELSILKQITMSPTLSPTTTINTMKSSSSSNNPLSSTASLIIGLAIGGLICCSIMSCCLLYLTRMLKLPLDENDLLEEVNVEFLGDSKLKSQPSRYGHNSFVHNPMSSYYDNQSSTLERPSTIRSMRRNSSVIQANKFLNKRSFHRRSSFDQSIYHHHRNHCDEEEDEIDDDFDPEKDYDDSSLPSKQSSSLLSKNSYLAHHASMFGQSLTSQRSREDFISSNPFSRKKSTMYDVNDAMKKPVHYSGKVVETIDGPVYVRGEVYSLNDIAPRTSRNQKLTWDVERNERSEAAARDHLVPSSLTYSNPSKNNRSSQHFDTKEADDAVLLRSGKALSSIAPSSSIHFNISPKNSTSDNFFIETFSPQQSPSFPSSPHLPRKLSFSTPESSNNNGSPPSHFTLESSPDSSFYSSNQSSPRLTRKLSSKESVIPPSPNTILKRQSRMQNINDEDDDYEDVRVIEHGVKRSLTRSGSL